MIGGYVSRLLGPTVTVPRAGIREIYPASKARDNETMGTVVHLKDISSVRLKMVALGNISSLIIQRDAAWHSQHYTKGLVK